MENCHKVRVYDDFPILFDYLKEIKQKRIRHICLTRFNDIKNYPQLEEKSQNNGDYSRVNSISFTRKIVDIQTKTNRDYCPSTTNGKCFENEIPLTTKLTASSTWQKDCFVDQRKKITSSCQNKYRVCKSDGYIYFVDHVNQTVIDKSNLIFCKRINHGHETYPAKSDWDNFDQQRYDCKSIYSNVIQNSDRIALKKRVNPFKFETKTESISNLHQPKINDYYCDDDDDCNLFSDLIEEEYKLLPNMTRNQTMLVSNNNDENKYIYEDNCDDVYETITNDHIDDEDELQRTNKSLINKSRGKNKSLRRIIPMDSDFTSLLLDDFQTPLSLSIPDWEELCERVYRLERNDNNVHDHDGDVMNNQKTLMMKKPKDQEKVFQLSIDNHYPVMMDTSSSQVLLNSQNFPKEINLVNHDSLNQTTTTTTTNNLPTENLDTKSSEIRTPIITDHDRSSWMENFDLKKFVCQQAERIFNLRKEILTKNNITFEKNNHQQYSNVFNIENMEHWINRLPYAESNEVCLNHSSNPFKLFLFDLCKETIVRLFPMDLIYSIELTLMLPLKMQKRPWPSDVETFSRSVIDNVEQILDLKKDTTRENICKQNFISSTITKLNNPLMRRANDNIAVKNSFNVMKQNNQTNIKRFGLMAYCRKQRKLDFVDQLLYQEMLADQLRWSYFEPEMMELKNSVGDTLPLVDS